MDNIFPSRKEILENSKKTKLAQYQESIVDSINQIEVEKIDFSKGDFKPRTKIAEKQKIFIWIRLYLKNEAKLNPEDIIQIKYIHSGETLDTKFICYAKKSLDKDNQDQIVNYNTEDDKKILCLMVDSDKINHDSNDIPFIRTLFKTSRYYDHQLLKREELLFTNLSNGEVYEYYDVDF